MIPLNRLEVLSNDAGGPPAVDLKLHRRLVLSLRSPTFLVLEVFVGLRLAQPNLRE